VRETVRVFVAVFVADRVTDAVPVPVRVTDEVPVPVELEVTLGDRDGVTDVVTEKLVDGLKDGTPTAITANVPKNTRAVLYCVDPPTALVPARFTVVPVVTAPELSSMRTACKPPGVPQNTVHGRKRILELADTTTQLLLLTDVEMDVHTPPERYCHAPSKGAASFLQMATPARALAVVSPALSAASEKLGENKWLTVSPGGFVVNWLMAARLALPVAMGASLTGSTNMLTKSVPMEKAVEPPFAVMLTFVPAVPLV
jgi:hypothetical protein